MTAVGSTVAAGWENWTTLIRTTDGVIFKENGVADISYIETLTHTWAVSAVTTDLSGLSKTGTVSATSLVFKQRNDNWIDYSSAADATPAIIAYMNNDFVFQVTYAATVLTFDRAINMPCNSYQRTAGCATGQADI